jgi:hypothetical protein
LHNDVPLTVVFQVPHEGGENLVVVGKSQAAGRCLLTIPLSFTDNRRSNRLIALGRSAQDGSSSFSSEVRPRGDLSSAIKDEAYAVCSCLSPSLIPLPGSRVNPEYQLPSLVLVALGPNSGCLLAWKVLLEVSTLLESHESPESKVGLQAVLVDFWSAAQLVFEASRFHYLENI